MPTSYAITYTLATKDAAGNYEGNPVGPFRDKVKVGNKWGAIQMLREIFDYSNLVILHATPVILPDEDYGFTEEFDFSRVAETPVEISEHSHYNEGSRSWVPCGTTPSTAVCPSTCECTSEFTCMAHAILDHIILSEN